ncbi:MAG: hypothetical protein B7Z10_13045 [Rhodobacterales bacterium 32-66-7]|nr:MAG: hypothetical protein B7Z31_07515 [Rhodobacterales bacterium 12-65-15]OYX22571.1 MAG: hypothetical protein B7Z10_13045 [Rhodobacterales bacterium 32-66-7]
MQRGGALTKKETARLCRVEMNLDADLSGDTCALQGEADLSLSRVQNRASGAGPGGRGAVDGSLSPTSTR